jgi:hypothetical protein
MNLFTRNLPRCVHSAVRAASGAPSTLTGRTANGAVGGGGKGEDAVPAYSAAAVEARWNSVVLGGAGTSDGGGAAAAVRVGADADANAGEKMYILSMFPYPR